MAFKIKLRNISVTNTFRVFYRKGRTPGSVAAQSADWSTNGGFYVGEYPSSTTSVDITVSNVEYGSQYWVKLLDMTTGSYIIENVYIHEFEFYRFCETCCDFSGGTSNFIQYDTTPTPVPPTPTPIPPTATPVPPTPTPIVPTATPIPPTATPVGPTATPIPPTATPIPPTATPVPPTPTPMPGTCYEMRFPTSVLVQNGQDLYLNYRRTDGNTVQWPYYQFLDSGAQNGYYTINICSEVYPSIRYGTNGFLETPEGGIIVTENGGCLNSVGCGGNDPTPPPPTPTPTPIVGDSGLCYDYTLNSAEIQLFSGITVNYTPLGTNISTTVSATNGVQSYANQDGTYTYYICSKTDPIFYDGQYAVVAFSVNQNGACDAENNCQNPILPPTPTPTPCPSNGTFINSYCVGPDLHTETANGSCGTTTTISYNDNSCAETGGGGSGGY